MANRNAGHWFQDDDNKEGDYASSIKKTVVKHSFIQLSMFKKYVKVTYKCDFWHLHHNHETNIRNLFAIGEAASIYHGANRLGENSLLAALYSSHSDFYLKPSILLLFAAKAMAFYFGGLLYEFKYII